MYKFLAGVLNATGNAKAEETKLAARRYAAALRLERIEEDEYQEFLRVSSLGAQVRHFIQSTQRLAESSSAQSAPSSAASARVTSTPALAVMVDSTIPVATATATNSLLTQSGDTALEEILFNHHRQYPLSPSTVDCLEALLSRQRQFERAVPTAEPVAPPSLDAAAPLRSSSINPGGTRGAGRGARSGDALPWRLVMLLLHRWHATLTDAAFLETGSAVFAYLETLFSCWCVLLDRCAVPRERLLSTPLLHTCLKTTLAFLSHTVTTQYCTRRATAITAAADAEGASVRGSAASLGTTRPTGARHGDAPVEAAAEDAPKGLSTKLTQPAAADSFSSLLLCLGLTCLLFDSPIAPLVRLTGTHGDDDTITSTARRTGVCASLPAPAGANANAVVQINVLEELLQLLVPFSKGHYTFRGLPTSRQGEQLPTFGMTCLCLILDHAPRALLEPNETVLTTTVVAADSILLARFSAGSDEAAYLTQSISAAQYLLASLLDVFPVSLCDAMENAFFFENAANALARVPAHLTVITDGRQAERSGAVTQQREAADVTLARVMHESLSPLREQRAPPSTLLLPCAPAVATLLDAFFALLQTAHRVHHRTVDMAALEDAGTAQLLSRLHRITATLFYVFTEPNPHDGSGAPGMTDNAANTTAATLSAPPSSSLLLCSLVAKYTSSILDEYPAYYHVLVELGLYAIIERAQPFAEDPVLILFTTRLMLERLTTSSIATDTTDNIPQTLSADVNLLVKQISASTAALRSGDTTAARPHRQFRRENLVIPLLLLEEATTAAGSLATTVQRLFVVADGFSRLCELAVVLDERFRRVRSPADPQSTAERADIASLERTESCVRTVVATLTNTHAAQTVLLREADASPLFMCFSMPRWRGMAAEAVCAVLQYRSAALSRTEYDQLLQPFLEHCWEAVRHCEELTDAAAPGTCGESSRGVNGDADGDPCDAARKDAVLLCLLRCFQKAVAGVAARAEDDAGPAVRALQEVIYQGGSGECFLRLVHRISLPWSLPADEGLTEIVRTVTAIMHGNPSMRARLSKTISAQELVRVLRTEWLEARPDDWAGLAWLVCVLIFEVVVPLPAKPEYEKGEEGNKAPRDGPALSLMVQNPAFVAASLHLVRAEAQDEGKRAVDNSSASAVAQRRARDDGLFILLHALTSCTAAHQVNLYLLANAGCFGLLADLLPHLMSLRHRRGVALSSLEGAKSLTDMAVALLTSMARHHVPVSEVKRLLLHTIVHAPDAVMRRWMVPVVISILSESVTAVLSGRRSPAYHLGFTRCSGTAAVRAALPALHEDGYSVSLWIRLETVQQPATSQAKGPSLQCLFSMQDAQRKTIFALAVDAASHTLTCLTRDARGEEVLVPLEGPPVPIGRWFHMTLLRRRPFALSTAGNTGEWRDASAPATLFGNPNTLKGIQLFIDGEEFCAVGRAGYTSVSHGAFVLGYVPAPVSTEDATDAECRAARLTSFVGQAASVYFFGRVLWGSEVRELYALAEKHYAATRLDGGGGGDGPPHVAVGIGGSGELTDTTDAPSAWAGVAPSVVVTTRDMGTETHLATDALVCIDARLCEGGQLYNLSALANGRHIKEARLQTFPGTMACKTTCVVDALSVLGAIYTVCMPLFSLLVNLHLPFTAAGLQPLRTADDACSSATAAERAQPVQQLLQLLDALLKVDVVLPDFQRSGVFVLVAQVLEALGPVLDAQVVTKLMELCLHAYRVSVPLFEPAYTSFFLSPDLLRACTRETQVLWINTHRISVASCEDDVRASMRSLGAQLFCVAELVEGLNDTAGSETVDAVATVPASVLRDQLFQLLDALTVDPITVADAVALTHLVTAAASTCRNDEVLHDVLAHTRVLIASRSHTLAQYLGRGDYAAVLIRLLQRHRASLAVRREALLQLMLLISRSKRTQELMNPNVILSSEVVHVAKDVCMAWLTPMLCRWGVPSTGTYLSLRSAVVGDFGCTRIPTTYTPLDTTVSVVVPQAIEPLLGVIKFADSSALKAHALSDLAHLLQRDSQGWRQLVAINEWYIQVINVCLSEYRSPEELLSQAASPLQRTITASGESLHASHANSWDTDLQDAGDPDAHNEGEEDESADAVAMTPRERTQAILTDTATVLASTLFPALLTENYAADELLCVVNYLETNEADALLSRMLLDIADRYLAKLSPRPAAVAQPPTAATFLLSTPAPPAGGATPSLMHTLRLEGPGLNNLVCFVQTVEGVLFCHPTRPAAMSPGAAAAPDRSDTTGLGRLLVLSSQAAVAAAAAGSREARDADWGLDDIRFVPLVTLPYEAQLDLMKKPDGRWPHLPLALRTAEILSTNSLLLHYGTSAATVGGVVSSEPVSSPLASVLSAGGGASAVSGSLLGNNAASGGVGSGGTGGPVSSTASSRGPRIARRLVKGGFLRIFGRLVCTVCQLTLRDGAALDRVLHLLAQYVELVEADQGGAFFLLRRMVAPDEATRDHSAVATSMQLLYTLNDLIVRRMRGDIHDAAPSHPFPTADLVRGMQGLCAVFRKSLQQTGLFAKSPPSESRAERYAKTATLQWLTTRVAPVTTNSQADLVMHAFAEISSRADYTAFVDHCLTTVERGMQTAKIVEAEVARERVTFAKVLEGVLFQVYRARKAVRENVMEFVARHRHATSELLDVDASDVPLSANGASSSDDPGSASADSSFLALGHTRTVLRTLRASTWTRFLAHLKGTLWNLDPAGQRHQKYVRLARREQQPLLRRKLVYDKAGTDHRHVTLPAHRPAKTTSLLAGESQLKESTLRLRGGEAVLLQDSKRHEDEEEEEAEEVGPSRTSGERGEGVDSAQHEAADAASIDGERHHDAPTATHVPHDFGSHSTGDPLADLENLRTPDAALLSPRHSIVSSVGQRSSPSLFYQSTADRADDVAVAVAASTPALLSLPCEVPHMMICWSATFAIRGTTVVLLIDGVNTAHNQVVPDEAKPFVLRPQNSSFDALGIEQLAPGRRFRMRRTAIEFWLSDRRSVFVNFLDEEAMHTALSTIYLVASNASARRDRGRGLAPFYVFSENPKIEPLRLQMMNEWQNRRLSNFEYLMFLNQLAGRSLNDLSQYPVFPWVIADYSSPTLDLTNVATFRDLRLPIGACGSEDRRSLVRSRYEEMKEMGDVPSHYFTHYSSPAVTLYYLVRLEPFTSLQILLQGGHLDHADRMFHSIQSCFRSVTTSSQDVRELIPELFYMPELCLNQNRVAFGVKQDGIAMNNLELPPWAHGDPYEFIYHMRRALESDFVSMHLHHWIDLIFGYKQRGKDAIESLNMFNWHSYEDLERNRGDSVDQQLLTDSLDNVGQTPIQLFRHPHKARPPRELVDPADGRVSVRPKVMTMRWGCPGVALVRLLANGRTVVVSTNGAVASFRYVAAPVYRATTTFHEPPPSQLFSSPLRAAAHSSAAAATAARAVGDTLLGLVAGPEQFSFDMAEEHERRIPALPYAVLPDWEVADRFAGRLAGMPSRDGSVAGSETMRLGSGNGDDGTTGAACGPRNAVVLNYDSESFVAIGGLFDNSVVIRPLSGARRDVRLMAHSGRVTHLAASRDSRYMVSGAEDTTFIVWRCYVPARRSPQLEVELLFAVHGHEENPSAAEVSTVMDILATASADGVLMLHTLSTGGLERTLRHPAGHSIDRILLLSNCYVPNLIFASNTDHVVHQYSVNGARLRTLSVPARITSWTMTPNQHLLIGCHAPPRNTGAFPREGVSAESQQATPTSALGEDTVQATVLRGGHLVLYVHSFFLDIRKAVPLATSGFITSIACHPTDAQVAVAGTSDGQLALLRVATPSQLAFS